jgi:hypothetical protein
MSIIDELQVFRPSYKGSFSHPTNHRRQVFVDSLRKQIRMIDGENLKGRQWWREEGGVVVACLRYATDVIDLGKGTHFTVSSLEDLKKVYEALIGEVTEGKFDEILESHWKKSSFNRKNRNLD